MLSSPQGTLHVHSLDSGLPTNYVILDKFSQYPFVFSFLPVIIKCGVKDGGGEMVLGLGGNPVSFSSNHSKEDKILYKCEIKRKLSTRKTSRN